MLRRGSSGSARQFVPGLRPSVCARTGVWTGRALELERALGAASAALRRRLRAICAVPRPCWQQAAGTSRRGACSSAGRQRGNASHVELWGCWHQFLVPVPQYHQRFPQTCLPRAAGAAQGALVAAELSGAGHHGPCSSWWGTGTGRVCC